MSNLYCRFQICIALLCATVGTAYGVDRIFLFPAGGANLITVIRADDTSVETTITAPPGVTDIIQGPTSEFYYILTRRSTGSIAVLDANTLAVTKTIDLGASAAEAKLTSDGRYLLITAGDLYIVDTQTNLLMPGSIQVGSGPTKIVTSGTFPRAYILADAGRTVQILNTDTLSIIDNIEVPNATDIALTEDEGRLLVAHRDGLIQYGVTNNERLNEIPSKFDFINPKIHLIPETQKVLIQSAGSSPNNTSAIIDLDTTDLRDVGGVGSDELAAVAVTGPDLAYGVRSDDFALVSIDLTSTPSAVVTALPFGTGARRVDLSSNRKTLYVSSLLNAELFAVDAATGTAITRLALPIAPAMHRSVFDRSTNRPARIDVLGGNNQFQPPGTTLPVPLSVRILDAEGVPIPGAPVIFNDSAGIGLVIEPRQPALTNLAGIASITITIPDAQALDENASRQETDAEIPETILASALAAPDTREQDLAEILETILVDVSVSGLTPISLTVNVIRGIGLLKVSGDNQLVGENENFPQPLTLLGTDDGGHPLQTGTEISLAPFAAACEQLLLLTDPNGFATIKCKGSFLPSSISVLAGTITASIPSLQPQLGINLTTSTFKFSLAKGANQITIEKISGDNQLGPTTETLPSPLQFRLNSNFGGAGEVGVTITQVDGPKLLFSPRVLSTLPGRIQDIFVTFGKNAGQSTLKVVASAPGTTAGPPTLFYNVTATGGEPIRMDVSGSNQVGNIETTLPIPLRVVVINESNDVVPFPDVTWRILRGDATLTTSNDPTGAEARVRLGATPGPVEIVAAIGSLQFVFKLTAVPPEPASISTVSGQGQTLTTGLLSEPLIVRVSELNNRPAAGAIVTFTAPLNVRLHPPSGSPANPVQVPANLDGEASVRVELLGSASLSAEGAGPSQLANSVTVTASVGGQLSTSFLLNVVGRTPNFASNSITNAATFEAGVVPGGLASLFGAGLFEGIIGTENAGANISFRGTTVRIGGLPAPLLNLSAGPPEQINLQVPFGLTPNQTTVVEVENNGSRTSVAGVAVHPSQPGIFEIPLVAGGTIGAALNGINGALITPDTPIAHGQPVAMFFTGGGPISPPVQTGTLGPIPPSTMTLPVIVGVDNKGAELLFKGYAPGFLGLYQVNFIVPADARCGLRPLNIQVGGDVSPLSTLAILCP
jgi:uncharacterized protein (TIGR03437 family)